MRGKGNVTLRDTLLRNSGANGVFGVSRSIVHASNWASLIFERVHVVNNTAEDRGGAVILNGIDHILLDDSIFAHNDVRAFRMRGSPRAGNHPRGVAARCPAASPRGRPRGRAAGVAASSPATSPRPSRRVRPAASSRPRHRGAGSSCPRRTSTSAAASSRTTSTSTTEARPSSSKRSPWPSGDLVRRSGLCRVLEENDASSPTPQTSTKTVVVSPSAGPRRSRRASSSSRRRPFETTRRAPVPKSKAKTCLEMHSRRVPGRSRRDPAEF